MIVGFLDTRGRDDGGGEGRGKGPLVALLVWALAFGAWVATFVVPQCVTRSQPGYDLGGDRPDADSRGGADGR